MKRKYSSLTLPHTYRSDRLIKVFDPKSSFFIIKNENQKTVLEVFYDGQIIKNETACDRIFICDETENVSTVELKGSDLKHAMNQIEATLTRENLKTYQKKKTAVIVYSHSPANINSSRQIFSEKMRKNFNAKVFFLKSGNTIEYTELF